MTRAPLIGVGVVAAVGAGVAATLVVQDVLRADEAIGDGLAVVCSQQLDDCWQGGKKVLQPRNNQPCDRADIGVGGWSSWPAGPNARQGVIFACVAPGEAAD